MSIDTVLNSLKFWGRDNWAARIDVPPLAVSVANIDFITQNVTELYQRSPTARAMLGSLASGGAIRIGYSATLNARVPSNNAATPSDDYLLLSPDTQVFSITSGGYSYEVPFLITLAHELGHYAYGFTDVANPSNASFNTADYDFDGDNLRMIEWPVTDELGFEYKRASYTAQWTNHDPIAAQIHVGTDYNGDGDPNPATDYSEIVRLGDLEFDKNDYIDFQRPNGWRLHDGVRGQRRRHDHRRVEPRLAVRRGGR